MNTTLLILAGIAGSLLMTLPALADCGPQQEGPCKECGPHISDWIKDACPSATNDPFVGLPDSCEPVGSAPIQPYLCPPIYLPGSKHQHYTFDCPQNPATDGPPAAITFTVGSVYWNPHLPAIWTNAGSFSSTASVYVTSSDPTLCPSPGWIAVDPDSPVTTWTVVSTNCVESDLTIDPGSQWQPTGADFVGEPAGGASGYQFDGFSVTYSATFDVLCTCGCTTNLASGTRTSTYTKEETIEVYKAAQGDLPLPQELLEAVGTLIASEIHDNIPLYGVDPTYLNDIVNAINNNIPGSTNAGDGWQGGHSPCGS